jgi:hypothetical protein
MTILDEGKQIRSEVAKLRPDKRRRYPDGLRARILDWVGRATAAGMMECECSKAIGVKTWRFTLWRRASVAKPKDESLALVQIETPQIEFRPAGLSMVAPSGYRIEGLALAQVIVLLRELG